MKDSPAKKRLYVKDYYQDDGTILFYADVRGVFLFIYYIHSAIPPKN